MQEITINNSFGVALLKYSEGLEIGLEVGGGTGDGSTQCINTKTLYSIENHPDRISRHQYNLTSRKGGIAINELSSNPSLWMSVKDIEEFYRNTPTKLNQYPLETIIEWYREDLRIASSYTYGQMTLKDKIDFLLLDGGAFSGRADFIEWMPRVRNNGIIALDDINDIKNWANYKKLKESSRLLWEDLSVRNGAAIFQC